MAIDNNIPTFVERDPAVIMAESKAKLEEIIASYNESRTLRDLMLLLAPFQITPTLSLIHI